jgi:hypothetical protein
MRGFPLLRVLFLAGVLALTGLPVWKITRPAPVAPVGLPAEEENPKSSFDITLTSSTPAKFSLIAGGKKAGASSSLATSWKISLAMDAEKPDDLIVHGEALPDTKNFALRIQVDNNGKKLTDTTLWGTNTVEDVVAIPAP